MQPRLITPAYMWKLQNTWRSQHTPWHIQISSLRPTDRCCDSAAGFLLDHYWGWCREIRPTCTAWMLPYTTVAPKWTDPLLACPRDSKEEDCEDLCALASITCTTHMQEATRPSSSRWHTGERLFLEFVENSTGLLTRSIPGRPLSRPWESPRISKLWFPPNWNSSPRARL